LWALLSELSSANPDPYSVEVRLNGQYLETVFFPTPGIQQHEYNLSPDSTGSALLSFRVPHLWKPADLIQGSNDERTLGVAVRSIVVA